MSNRMLCLAREKEFINGLEIGTEKIILSHLQFIDDTMLFCPPDHDTLENYRRILDCFGMMSDLQINYHKSTLISVNMAVSKVKLLADEMSCSVKKLPIIYMGIPLGVNPKELVTWKLVLKNIEKKLSKWKAGLLSRVERLQ
ncbi:hypothetical protein AHAS_Ahas18G0283900 [Arachis hypogaea]